MIFVDTSAWLALADDRDRYHGAARAFARRLARGEFGKQVTTNYVLTETVTIVRRRLGIASALRVANGLEGSGEVRILWIEPVHHREAMQLLSANEDKEWSVTDCASFVVMKALELHRAFTFDHDFAQAGFQTLP